MKDKSLKIALVSSGDIIAKELLNILEERKLPVKSIDFITMEGSDGKIIQYKNCK